MSARSWGAFNCRIARTSVKLAIEWSTILRVPFWCSPMRSYRVSLPRTPANISARGCGSFSGSGFLGDLFTGFAHFGFDYVFPDKMPILGPVAKEFRQHHDRPTLDRDPTMW